MIKICERGRQEHPVCGDRGSFMTGTMFFNMLLNIGLLVLLATLLTNMASVRKLFRGENSTIAQKMALAVIFGAISIVSTYTGTKTGGAIVNTRVIGVLTAGIMGGPFVGMMTALIAGAHRFLFDIGGFTAASCAVSTLVEGVLGSLVYKKYKAGEMDSIDLFFLTAEAEILQMVIILMISKPLGAAMELVGKIAVPMIVMNSVGMVLFFKTFDMVYMREDSLFAERMRLSMGIADKSLVYLRKGFGKRENMEAVTDIIFGEIPCQAVIITDEKEVLAVSSLIDDSRFRREKFLEHLTGPAKGMKAECIWEEDLDEEIRPLFHSLVTVTVPVMTGDEKIGSLSIVVKKRRRVERSIGDFLEELAKMFSTQLGVYNVEYQKKLRKKAEFKALQSQVNPHFLYNALNTISCICDEDAGKASDLILTLASYYRQTLENDQYMLDIDTEINHVRTYLEIEKARFEEKLRVEINVEDGLSCQVPSFILQPIVENAVRYGNSADGVRRVEISAKRVQSGPGEELVRIGVRDHGKGFEPEEAERILTGNKTGSVGLKNVNERLKSTYGKRYGLEIRNTDDGADVSFCIPYQTES